MFYGTQSGCEGGSTSNTIPGSFGNGGSNTFYHYGSGGVENSGGSSGSGFVGGVINYCSHKNITQSCESTFFSHFGLEIQDNDSPGYSRIKLIEFS